MITKDGAESFSETTGPPPKIDAARAKRRERDLLASLAIDPNTGKPRRLGGNVSILLRHHPAWEGTLAFDELAGSPVWLRQPPEVPGLAPVGLGPFTETNFLRVQQWLATTYGVAFAREIVEVGMIDAAETRKFHAIRDYLDGLTWDGTPRLDTLLVDHAGAENTPYVRAVTSKTFIAAVARVRRPGCKVDTMLILEGAQGLGKSSLLAHLAGHDWFDDHLPDLRDKDAPLHLRGRWLVEVPELDAMKGAEATRIKSFVSRQVDRYRPPYARQEVESPRGCIFVGTTNASNYLADGTGGRRFWPVAVCKPIRASGIDRDQVWAEADTRFAEGAAWHLDETLEEEARGHQAARYTADPWEEALARELGHQGSTTTMSQCLSLLQVEARHQKQPDARRIADVLRRLGYVRRREATPSEKGRRAWVYFRGGETR